MTDVDVDVLAIGAGPANLALAAAAEELATPELAASMLLLEQHPDIKWQRDLLLPWARSQVSFLKDLATLRNPRSRFSFLNYLHTKGRLDEFVNMSTFHPYRTEMSDYLQWVADTLALVRIRYGARCERIEPRLGVDGGVLGWQVELTDGTTIGCRDLVVGAGRDPYIPSVFDALPADRLVHSSRYCSGIRGLRRDEAYRVVIIGGAQSAAEMFRAVHDDLPNCEPTIVLRATAFQNYQTSKFANERYFPSFVDEFFDANPQTRRQVLDEMRLTNYAGLAPPFLDELYAMMYQQRLSGVQRSKVLPMTDVVAAGMAGNEVVLQLRDRLTGRTYPMRCDLLLLGTGYDRQMPQLVRRLQPQLGLSRLTVNRDYRLELPTPSWGACYLQGVNEETHGISDSLISVLAHRSQRIVEDLLARRVETGTEPVSIDSVNAAETVRIA